MLRRFVIYLYDKRYPNEIVSGGEILNGIVYDELRSLGFIRLAVLFAVANFFLGGILFYLPYSPFDKVSHYHISIRLFMLVFAIIDYPKYLLYLYAVWEMVFVYFFGRRRR